MRNDQKSGRYVGTVSVVEARRTAGGGVDPLAAPGVEPALEAIRESLKCSRAAAIRAVGASYLAVFASWHALEEFACRFFDAARGCPRGLAMRCGVAFAPAYPVGEAVPDDAAAAARRLCSVARSGQILLAAASGRALPVSSRVVLLEVAQTRPREAWSPATIWEVSELPAVDDPDTAGTRVPRPAPGLDAPWPEAGGSGTRTEWDGSGSTFDFDLDGAGHGTGPRPGDLRTDPAASGGVCASITLIHAGQILTSSCAAGAIEIGRRVHAGALRVDHPGVSALHCSIENRDGLFWIVDRSTNATLVLGDGGSTVRVHHAERAIRDASGWIMLGHTARAARIRYHVLQAMEFDRRVDDLQLALH